MISEGDMEHIERILARRDNVREKVLEISRIVIRHSARAIVETHRGEFTKAKNNLKIVERYIDKMQKAFSSDRELGYSGSVITAYQEYAEAKLLYNLIADEKILSLKDSGLEPIPYLLGLLDFIGELRRVILNCLIKGDVEKASKIFNLMESTYEDIFSIDHTAIIPNFRRKLDNVRRIVEFTRGDIATETRRISLENAIREVEKKFFKKLKT